MGQLENCRTILDVVVLYSLDKVDAISFVHAPGQICFCSSSCVLFLQPGGTSHVFSLLRASFVVDLSAFISMFMFLCCFDDFK